MRIKTLGGKFEQQKKFALERLERALAREEVDEGVISLIGYVNSLRDFYTTSTCSGRISIFQDLGNKKDNFSLQKWHREVWSGEIEEILKKIPETGITWFIYEPAILHIAAKNLNEGKKLLQIALSSGFKHSGVQGLKEERFLIEIFSTGRMDVPIGKAGRLLVSENYLRYLTKLANEKIRKEQKKLKKLEQILRENLK